jgi:hypothetical protein
MMSMDAIHINAEEKGKHCKVRGNTGLEIDDFL